MTSLSAIAGRLAAVAGAGAVLAAVGCGSDDQGTTAEATANDTLRVIETDFALDPARARVEQAGTVRISVVNRGQAPHALAIETPDGVVRTDTVDPGGSGDVEANLEAGTYTWYCPVGDHRARGMEGTLSVASGGEDDEPEEERPAGAYGY